MFLPLDTSPPAYPTVYFLALVGVVPAVDAARSTWRSRCRTPARAPAAHPLDRLRVRCVLQAALQPGGAYSGTGPAFTCARTSARRRCWPRSLLFVARCAAWPCSSRDPLVAQRARILLAGAVLRPGAVRGGAVRCARHLGALEIDSRFTIWPLAHLRCRAGARHAAPGAAQRAHRGAPRGALHRRRRSSSPCWRWCSSPCGRTRSPCCCSRCSTCGRASTHACSGGSIRSARAFRSCCARSAPSMAAAPTVDAVLDVARRGARAAVQRAQQRRLPARRRSPARPSTSRAASASARRRGGRPLADELIVQLMRATRREILRAHLAVEPQYANIRDECDAGVRPAGRRAAAAAGARADASSAASRSGRAPPATSTRGRDRRAVDRRAAGGAGGDARRGDRAAARPRARVRRPEALLPAADHRPGDGARRRRRAAQPAQGGDRGVRRPARLHRRSPTASSRRR